MRKNNNLILNLSTLILIVLTSNNAHSGDHIYRPDHYFRKATISTPEIKRQTEEAIAKCHHFAVHPSSPQDEVYWSISPRTDKQREKEFSLNYLKQVQSEARNAEVIYYKQLQKIAAGKAYQEQREYQRRIQIEHENARRKEQQKLQALHDPYYQRQNAQRALYHQSQAYKLAPKSPEDTIIWKEYSPIHSRRENAPVALYDEVKASIEAPVELSITSNEASNKESGGSSSDPFPMHALIQDILDEAGASNKENKDNPMQLISQVPQKRSRDEMTPETQISPHPHSLNMFSEGVLEPTQLYSCFAKTSPQKKRMPKRSLLSSVR